MSSTIDQYRDAKTQYLRLRAEAKKDLLRRYQELANELLTIQRELLEDFDHKVKLPAKPQKVKAKKSAPAPAQVRAAAAPTSKAATPVPARAAAAAKGSSSSKESAPLFAVKNDDPSAEEANIMKHIEKNKKKLAEAQAAGKPTKPIEDRLYELEDELRLVQSR